MDPTGSFHARAGMTLAFLGLAALVAPALAETPAETEVRGRSRAVAAAEARLDADAVTGFWTEDAVVHFAGAAPLVGRDAIHRMYADAFAKLKSFRGETSELHVSSGADMAWETGRTFSTRADPADAKESTGKYLLVWRKDGDGIWRIAACAATADPKP
jgi:uncharacterized protein (TIGR02246 family)